MQDVDHLLDRGEAFRCIRLMPSCSEVHEDGQSCSPSKTQRFRQYCSGSTPSLHQLQLPCTIIRDPAARHWLSVPGIGWIWFAHRGQAYHQDTVLYRFVTIYGHAVWICLAMPGHGLAHLPPYGAPDPYLGPPRFAVGCSKISKWPACTCARWRDSRAYASGSSCPSLPRPSS